MGFQGWELTLLLFLGFSEGLAGAGERGEGVPGKGNEWGLEEASLPGAWFTFEHGHLPWKLDFRDAHRLDSAFRHLCAIWTRSLSSLCVEEYTVFSLGTHSPAAGCTLGEHSTLCFNFLSYLCLLFCPEHSLCICTWWASLSAVSVLIYL